MRRNLSHRSAKENVKVSKDQFRINTICNLKINQFLNVERPILGATKNTKHKLRTQRRNKFKSKDKYKNK